jgi:glycine/D-amino acid oxidase-like deaminating enzyme
MEDMIVIGGSYAGMAAALQLVRARRRVAVIDARVRRNRFASHSHGFLGQDGVDPAQLWAEAQRQLLAYPTLRWVDGVAGAVSGHRDAFRVSGGRKACILKPMGAGGAGERRVNLGGQSTDAPQVRDLEALGRLQSEAQHPVEAGMAHPKCAEGRSGARADSQADGEQDHPKSVDVYDVVHDGADLRTERIARETDIGQEEKDHGQPPGEAMIQNGK